MSTLTGPALTGAAAQANRAPTHSKTHIHRYRDLMDKVLARHQPMVDRSLVVKMSEQHHDVVAAIVAVRLPVVHLSILGDYKDDGQSSFASHQALLWRRIWALLWRLDSSLGAGERQAIGSGGHGGSNDACRRMLAQIASASSGDTPSNSTLTSQSSPRKSNTLISCWTPCRRARAVNSSFG